MDEPAPEHRRTFFGLAVRLLVALSLSLVLAYVGYLAIVLIRQHRLTEANALARAAHNRDVRLLVIGETAEHAPTELGAALGLLDSETIAVTPPEELSDLTASIARHAPAHLDVILGKLTRRGVDVRSLKFGKSEKMSGDKVKQVVTIRVGVEQELSKKIVKMLKDSKLKVQASIQGDAVRVSSAKRDDLQSAIAAVKKSITDFPLQFGNFRD